MHFCEPGGEFEGIERPAGHFLESPGLSTADSFIREAVKADGNLSPVGGRPVFIRISALPGDCLPCGRLPSVPGMFLISFD
jgi:hypothetical protein